LAGFIPIEMFELTELTGLSMDHNKNIYGQIPEEIAWLEKLTYIDLDDNYLQGSIPSEIYGMTALQAIDLNANRLTGTISSDIGNLENLMVLQLEDNYFQGTIPETALAKLDKLRKFLFTVRALLHDCGFVIAAIIHLFIHTHLSSRL
jgi:Leucine-rich repeat (LRR) protein